MKTRTLTLAKKKLENNFLKNFCFVLVLFSGMVFGQPPINNPTPYELCDNGNDNVEIFDLSTKSAEILGLLDPELYYVNYFTTLTGVNNNTDYVFNPTNYVSGNQTIYVKVTDVFNQNNFNITSLNLVLISAPTYGSPTDLYVEDIPFDGSAVFEITMNSSVLINGQNNISVTYYTNQTNAQSASAPILSPTTYVGSNGQRVWARVESSITGCYSIASFRLFTTNPNIVLIQDTNFKAKLLSANTTNYVAYNVNGNSIIVDINADGEIQNTEALTVYRLDVNDSSIYSLNGISSFTNIETLNCQSNPLTTLDVNSLLNLHYLNCSYDSLTSLAISNLTAIRTLNCQSNYLTLVTINPVAQIEVLDVSFNSLTSLSVNSLTFLKKLYCSYNHLTSLVVNNLTNLEFLMCFNNEITSLNINSLINLYSLQCADNLLTTLDVSGINFLSMLGCHNNLLTTFDLSTIPYVNHLSIGNQGFQSLNYNALPDLYSFMFYGGIQTSIDISNLSTLSQVGFINTNLTSIDISANHNLTSVNSHDNLSLLSLNMKCGSAPNYQFVNCPIIQFICVDDELLADIQSGINMYNINLNVVINSYCSFTPGGNYNTITGQIKFDANNNGCDINDLSQPNIRININDGTNTGATFTNNLGTYNFYTQTGSFVLTPAIENPTWFTFSPTTATIPFANNNNNTTTQNFCIAANGVHNDVEVVISPITPARPGFDAIYKIVYKNKGNQALSGNVNFTYDDGVLDFVSATVAPNSQNTGVLNWNYANLLPFENRNFYVTLHVNVPTASPPVNLGDVLSFNASITPMITDENPLDNSFTYNQIVVGSFDPNNITCLEGAIVPPSTIGSYLHYGVNFENTGTYPAENIVVKVVIDTAKYDVNSLQMLNTSNPAYTKITGNVVEFIFKNIMLDTGGHGNVLFKIKTNNNLFNGDIVSKRADIFFDYNAPINTGMANTTFQLLNNMQFVIDNSIEVSPNPTSSIISINGTSSIKSVQVYDVQGRLLETKLVDDAKATINISDKTNGIYFLKITTENGSKVEKIIKE
jgi:hypothetical protein